MKGTLTVSILLVAAIGCGGEKTEKAPAPETGNDTTAAPEEPAVADKTKAPPAEAPADPAAEQPAPPAREPLAPGAMPFEFPIVDSTDAQPGERVFAVNMKLVMNAYNEGKDKFQTQYLISTMKTPGDKASEVAFVGTETVPNSGIVRIPPGATAKKDDIVAGVWAVNMTRGVVTDASNPKAPKVRFIGLDYDNPAKAEDGKTGIGVFDYTLKENEFIVISEPFAPASACAVKRGNDYKLMEVFRAVGDSVMGTIFTEFTAVPKADCIPLPIRPTYKKGDAVWAPWVGTMSKGTITKVDTGRYNIKFDEEFKKEAMISFGEVIDKLP